MKTDTERDFLNVVDTYSHIIYKICYVYAVDEDNLKDLYQETVINLWKGYASFRGTAKISSWIYRVGINTCISYYRQDRKYRNKVDLAKAGEVYEDHSERTEQLKEMYRLINKLDKMEKAMILLWLDEKSYDEIAEITGMGRNTVASKLKRAKEKLIEMNND